MAKTIEMLKSEHEVMARLLDVLDEQLTLFEGGERVDYELLKELVDYFLTVPDLYHHPKEDLIHARMRRRDSAAMSDLHDLPAEHAQGSERLGAFSRALISVLLDTEFPRERFIAVARDFVDNERAHMEGENAHFFPLAENTLTDEDWQEVDSRACRLTDPLMHGESSYRFPTIRDRLDG
jgi:hemerythrin-like domain-containing protein